MVLNPDVVVVVVVVSSVVVVVVIASDSRLIVATSGLFFSVGLIGTCLICWSIVGSSILLF